MFLPLLKGEREYFASTVLIINININDHLLCDGVVREGGLVRVPLLAELHVAEEQRGGDNLEDGVQLLVRHPHHLSREAVQNRVGNKKTHPEKNQTNHLINPL
jgi:hypothetical protein